MSTVPQDTNLPAGGVELDENGKPLTPELTPEQKEQALIEKGRAIRQNDPDSTPPAHVKPEGIPDEFFDATTGAVDYVAMAKSYTALQAKVAGTPAAEAAPKDPAAPKQEPAATPDTPFTLAAREFAEKGAVTAETYAVLAEKHGIPKELVDTFVEGQLAKQQLQQQTSSAREEQLLGTIGGKDAFATMSTWAAQTFSEAELNAFNQQVGLSAESAALALQFLKTRYEAANGRDPKLLTTGRPAAQVVDGFANKSEMMAAMRDPRYKSDAAFQAEVARKMANRQF